MKKSVFNIIAILCAVFIHNTLTGFPSHAKDYEKVIKKEFTISDDGRVSIANSYGNVKINTTGGNEVVIKVTLKVDEKNEDKAQDFFDRVEIDFTNSRSEVSARTEIGNKKGSSWTKWLKPSNWNSKNDYSINYEVWMPATCSLNLKNRYGDIAVGDVEGDVRLQLKYGDGVMEDIGGDFNLDLGYGDLRIGNANDMELDIKYGEFKCESSKDVTCDSKYSEIYIDKAGRFVADSGYDDYFLGEIETLINEGHYDDFQIEYVNNIDFDSRYSDYEIDKLGSGGVFDAGYGGLKVKQVAGLSNGLDVDASYSNVSLRMDIPFSIELESKYADIKLPSNMDYTTKIKDGNENRFVGKSANGSNANKIKVEMRYGSFRIRDGF